MVETVGLCLFGLDMDFYQRRLSNRGIDDPGLPA